MELSQLVSIPHGLWCLTFAAGWANVATKEHVTLSRACNAVTVLSVTANYGLQCLDQADSAHLAGLVMFGVSSAGACLITAPHFSNRTRSKIALGSFALGTALSVGSQLTITHGFNPLTFLPIAASGIGYFTNSANVMASRRLGTMTGGVPSLIFGMLTNNWGMAAKNLFIDIGVNGCSMLRYKENPVPLLRSAAARGKSLAKKILHL